MGLYWHLVELLSVQVKFFELMGEMYGFLHLPISQHTTNMYATVLEV